MLKILFSKSLVKTFIILAIFLLPFFALWLYVFAPLALDAATSPDAIAFRVMPNPGHLSPLRWYQENIKLKGSPQTLVVDGYEAVRDGRTVYVNAANIDLKNRYCSKDQSISCSTSDTQCVSAGGACVPKFYSNIYIISYNQQAENETVDIFAQILAHWKFNTNISEPEDNSETVAQSCLYSSECPTGEYCLSKKAKIIRDTKRLADLADIELILDNYQKAHSGDYPALSAGSYIASTSLSVWPSWQATLAKELGVTLPVDPVNRLVACPEGYDQTTCWNQTLKKFAGIPANSQVYVYKYNGKKSYNLCAFMESGYLTTLQGACAGSAVGYKVKCVDDATAWSSKYIPDNVCKGQKIVETSNCGNTRVVFGKKTGGICGCVSTSGKPCTSSATNNCGIPGSGYFDCAGNCPATPPDNGTIVCSGNTDCDDGKACTTDICNNPNTCNSSCSNPAISGTHLACLNHSCVATANTSSTCTNQNSCATAGAACDCSSLVGTACPSTANNCGTYGSSVYYDCLGNCPVTRPADVNITCNSQPNCQTSQPANSVPNPSGGSNVCCDGKTCYQCAAGYSWNGTNCEVSTRPCAKPWGGTIAHGQRITAWQASSVAYGLDCVSESRLCTDSTLSGSYQSQSCVAPGCGDGNLDAGNGEVCDKGATSLTLTKTTSQYVNLSAKCVHVSVSGTETCNDNCDGWNPWVASPPVSVNHTATACDPTNAALNDAYDAINNPNGDGLGYACCELTKCSQDGCSCCGRSPATTPQGYTSASTMDISWELWGTRQPDIGKCQTGVRCGDASCVTFYSLIGINPPGNAPISACRLSRNNRYWYITTDHSTAYYQCWK